jgi:hypothetical protein
MDLAAPDAWIAIFHRILLFSASANVCHRLNRILITGMSAIACPIEMAGLLVVSQDTRPRITRVDDLRQFASGRPDDLDEGRILVLAPLFDLRLSCVQSDKSTFLT